MPASISSVRLRQPTADECELVRLWRNDPAVLPTLRTKEPLTKEQQAAFYRDVVCNPASNHRYYALEHEICPCGHAGSRQFIGLGGLTYLDRVPGIAEISLLLGPDFRREGLGAPAVDALRREGHRIGLRWIEGECYDTNPAQRFWIKVVTRTQGSVAYSADRIHFRMPVQTL